MGCGVVGNIETRGIKAEGISEMLPKTGSQVDSSYPNALQNDIAHRNMNILSFIKLISTLRPGPWRVVVLRVFRNRAVIVRAESDIRIQRIKSVKARQRHEAWLTSKRHKSSYAQCPSKPQTIDENLSDWTEY